MNESVKMYIELKYPAHYNMLAKRKNKCKNISLIASTPLEASMGKVWGGGLSTYTFNSIFKKKKKKYFLSGWFFFSGTIILWRVEVPSPYLLTYPKKKLHYRVVCKILSYKQIHRETFCYFYGDLLLNSQFSIIKITHPFNW